MSLAFSGWSLMARSRPVVRRRMIHSFSSSSNSLAVSGPLGSRNCDIHPHVYFPSYRCNCQRRKGDKTASCPFKLRS